MVSLTISFQTFTKLKKDVCMLITYIYQSVGSNASLEFVT